MFQDKQNDISHDNWRALNVLAAASETAQLTSAGVECRFHDLRCTAVTVMTEAGLPDHTIMAQVGHVSPEMLKHYSRTRRLALNDCAAALQPSYSTTTTLEMVN